MLGSLAHASDFVGVWKTNCSNFYGVKIQRIANNFYSISFCGYSCFEPGTWTPNSSIIGDWHYKVVTPTRIGIRRTDNPNKFFFYNRCSSDPKWHFPTR